MTPITFPASSSPGLKPQETAGRLVNMLAEKLDDGRVICRRAPGLRQAFDITAHSHCRGFLAVGSTLVVVLDERIYTVTESGGVYTMTDRGALPGTGLVTLARNNTTPTPEIAAVADGIAYQVSLSGAPINWPDADVGSPNAVTSIDGYFVWTYGDARARSSGLNTTAINTLDYAFAESKPDGLLRPITYRRELFLFGTATIEAWRNTGNASGFPFSFVDSIPRGLIGASAVAGHEDGWAGALIWVGDDGIVYRLDGYTPTRISTHAVERMIATAIAAGDGASLEASVFMHAGHACWALSSPDWTWVFDLTTQAWHERESYGGTRWRASCSVKAFNKWLVGDRSTGKVFEIAEDYYREGNDPLVARAQSLVSKPFPQRAVIARMDYDVSVGVGVADGLDPIQTAPRVSISWSNDGGATWSLPQLRELGAQGDFGPRVGVTRTGMAGPAGRVSLLECSDPVYFSISGGEMTAAPRG